MFRAWHPGLVAPAAESKVWNSLQETSFLENTSRLVTSVYFLYLDISGHLRASPAAPLYLSEGAVLS